MNSRITRSITMLGATIALCLQVRAVAVVTPILIKLESDPTDYLATYTVPMDKILIIDAIQFNNTAGIELVATNGVVMNISRKLIDSLWEYSEGLYSLNRSIKIPYGVLLRTPLALSSETNSACVYGSLVDANDLYARVQPIIQNISTSFPEGIAVLAVSAGADSVIRVERCSDISADDWYTTATFSTGISMGRTMSLANEDSSRQFFRLRTLSR